LSGDFPPVRDWTLPCKRQRHNDKSVPQRPKPLKQTLYLGPKDPTPART
jgi:hypothetical protein